MKNSQTLPVGAGAHIYQNIVEKIFGNLSIFFTSTIIWWTIFADFLQCIIKKARLKTVVIFFISLSFWNLNYIEGDSMQPWNFNQKLIIDPPYFPMPRSTQRKIPTHKSMPNARTFPHTRMSLTNQTKFTPGNPGNFTLHIDSVCKLTNFSGGPDNPEDCYQLFQWRSEHTSAHFV